MARDLETPSEGTRYFYVSAIEGSRRFLIAGPYDDHAAALAQVDPVRKYASDQNGRAHFMAWGTAGSVEPLKTPLGAIDMLPQPWANANRVADDHAADVSSLEAEGAAAAARKLAVRS